LYKNDISYIGEERKIRVPNAFFKVIIKNLPINLIQGAFAQNVI